MAWSGIGTQTTSDLTSAANINQLMENLRVVTGNSTNTTAPVSDIATLNTAVNAAITVSIKTATSDYTILDGDGYTDILVDPSGGDVDITLPTAADNANRQINVKVISEGGLVTVDGEGAELIDSQSSFYLNGQFDRISVLNNVTGWIVKDLRATFDTGWINRSDWTVVQNGSVEVTYDNLGGGGFTVGEMITEAVSGNTGIIMADSGTVLKLKNVTGTGIFTNNRQITGATSGETADVNEVGGSTKNQDSQLFHNLGTSSANLRIKLLVSEDKTEANLYHTVLDIYTGSVIGSTVDGVDTDNVSIRTGDAAIGAIIDAAGSASNNIDSDDWYYKYIVQRVI